MYVLQLKVKGSWRVGQNHYDTIEDAQKRIEELKAVGIKARARLVSEVIG